ncbi:MAG: hypothetical protein CMF50_02935 [Legionellales bacterium]|mgnify:CR=1 FL=1|nr:hypothetical protein [Legionellales bacterium]|tara:strand:- start:41333 stop:43168 length:1836 start_codon:yes stop_codon:yes gene_type:complete
MSYPNLPNELNSDAGAATIKETFEIAASAVDNLPEGAKNNFDEFLTWLEDNKAQFIQNSSAACIFICLCNDRKVDPKIIFHLIKQYLLNNPMHDEVMKEFLNIIKNQGVDNKPLKSMLEQSELLTDVGKHLIERLVNLDPMLIDTMLIDMFVDVVRECLTISFTLMRSTKDYPGEYTQESVFEIINRLRLQLFNTYKAFDTDSESIESKFFYHNFYLISSGYHIIRRDWQSMVKQFKKICSLRSALEGKLSSVNQDAFRNSVFQLFHLSSILMTGPDKDLEAAAKLILAYPFAAANDDDFYCPDLPYLEKAIIHINSLINELEASGNRRLVKGLRKAVQALSDLLDGNKPKSQQLTLAPLMEHNEQGRMISDKKDRLEKINSKITKFLLENIDSPNVVFERKFNKKSIQNHWNKSTSNHFEIIIAALHCNPLNAFYLFRKAKSIVLAKKQHILRQVIHRLQAKLRLNVSSAYDKVLNIQLIDELIKYLGNQATRSDEHIVALVNALANAMVHDTEIELLMLFVEKANILLSYLSIDKDLIHKIEAGFIYKLAKIAWLRESYSLSLQCCEKIIDAMPCDDTETIPYRRLLEALDECSHKISSPEVKRQKKDF